MGYTLKVLGCHMQLKPLHVFCLSWISFSSCKQAGLLGESNVFVFIDFIFIYVSFEDFIIRRI
jgi:hypothetical protein